MNPKNPFSLAKDFQIEILAKIELTSTDERKTGKRRCNGPLIIVDRGLWCLYASNRLGDNMIGASSLLGGILVLWERGGVS